MINQSKWIALAVLSGSLLVSNPVFADSYTTSAWGTIEPVSGDFQNTPFYSTQNGPSAITISGSQDGVNYSGYAAASQSVLHAQASFNCLSCIPATGNVGLFSMAQWYEPNAKVSTVGPGDLLAGIQAYEVVWNLHGTVSPVDSYAAAILEADVTQGGVTKSSFATYFADPLGPVTFYLQPPNLLQPFNFAFTLNAFGLTGPGGLDHADVDFSNTATLASFEALDGSGQVIPGVYLQLANGYVLDSSGLATTPPDAPPTAQTPEPSSLVMLGTGVIVAFGSLRRRLLN